MYDISGLQPDRKEVAIGILVVVFILVVCFSAGYLLGLTHAAKDVHNNGSGTEPITNELGQVGTNTGNATAGIGQAENHAGNIEAGISNAQESADYLQGTVSTSAELIGQSKSIIERVRSRGKKETP
jgi:hypothetical protein